MLEDSITRLARYLLDGTVNGLNDWYVKKAKFPDLDVADYARTFFPALTLAEQIQVVLE
jgi:hypothetical protein